MSIKVIPLLPMPLSVAKSLAHNFVGFGARFEKFFPYLKLELKQAEIDFRVKDYLALCFMTGIIYVILSLFVMSMIWVRLQSDNLLFFSPLASVGSGIFAFLYVSAYPKIVVSKKVRAVDSNLIFALRALLVEIRSGVPLFESMRLIAHGRRFHEVSDAFKKAVDKISAGVSEDEALQEVATNNPSLFFRRAIWQIVTGLRGGSDISDVLTDIVKTMAREQKIELQKYGASLRLLSLLYMLLAVIMPALGVTFLIVLSSFPQIAVTEVMFWGLLLFVGVGQFMYLGILKGKRPSLVGS